MLIIKRNKTIEKLLNIFLILILPLVVFAPMGTWILLISIMIFLICLDSNSKNYFKNKNMIILFLFFIFITLTNYLFINFNLKILNKIISLYMIIFSGFIILNGPSVKLDNKWLSRYFSISFIFSSLIILIDYNFQLGLKLWLSNNFDFNNFINLYTFKSWISLNEFHADYKLLVINHLDNTYDRGITALSVLIFPISALCFFYNMKKTAILLFFLIFIVLCTFINLTAFIAFFISTLLLLFLINVKLINKNIFLVIFAIYFFSFPFLVGNLNYKKFASYENNIELKKKKLLHELKQQHSLSHLSYCNTETKTLNAKNCKKSNVVKFSQKLKLYQAQIEQRSIHRRVIWSFTKEKIIERPILGHGVFSSRTLGNKYQLINMHDKKMPAIPLHPHNGLMQIWLELGLVGVILFYILILVLINKIYMISKYNTKYSAFGIVSLCQILFIGQLSYGFWQSWWISVILINIFVFRVLYKTVLNTNKFN